MEEKLILSRVIGKVSEQGDINAEPWRVIRNLDSRECECKVGQKVGTLHKRPSLSKGTRYPGNPK